jgi:hypothetical protein
MAFIQSHRRNAETYTLVTDNPDAQKHITWDANLPWLVGETTITAGPMHGLTTLGAVTTEPLLSVFAVRRKLADDRPC